VPRLTKVLAAVVTIGVAGTYAASAADASTTSGSGAASTATTRILVKFSPTATAADRASALSAVSATDVGTVRDLDVHVLSVPASAADKVITALSHRADVTYAEPDATTEATQTPNDPGWTAQWDLAKVNAPAAWDKTTGSSSVVVAVLDSGVDFTHPDLQGRFVAGYDFIDNDTDPTDQYGHGTSIAGILGASSNNAIGLAGTCWTCMIMPVRVLDANGSGTYSTLSNGITWATDHGASVISMSLVGSADSSTLHSAVQYAHNHGVVLVAAAGNAGNSTLTYPASYPEVIGVAGTQSNDTLYTWSSYGSWVKVAAPGCDYTTLMGGGYGTACGTSSSTPIVAGIAGLAKSVQPSATNAQIEAAIESSAVGIGSSVSCGRVDALATLTALSTGATSASCAGTSGTSGSTGGTTGGTTKNGGGKKH
jgi:subtilisin family serine protease